MKPVEYIWRGIEPPPEKLMDEKFNKEYFLEKVLKEYYDAGVLWKVVKSSGKKRKLYILEEP